MLLRSIRRQSQRTEKADASWRNRPSASAEPQGQLAGQVMHISLDLSQATWLVTALFPGVDKMSKHTTTGGDGVALIELLDRLRAKIDPRSPRSVRVIAIRGSRAGRFLGAPPAGGQRRGKPCRRRRLNRGARRRRRAKTDSIDGETLLRTLLAWRRRRTSCLRYGRPALRSNSTLPRTAVRSLSGKRASGRSRQCALALRSRFTMAEANGSAPWRARSIHTPRLPVEGRASVVS